MKKSTNIHHYKFRNISSLSKPRNIILIKNCVTQSELNIITMYITFLLKLWICSSEPPDLYCALLTSNWQRKGGQHDNDYYFGVFSLLFRQRTPLLRFTASSRRPFPNRCPPSPLRKGKVRKNKKQKKKVNQSAKFIHELYL